MIDDCQILKVNALIVLYLFLHILPLFFCAAWIYYYLSFDLHNNRTFNLRISNVVVVLNKMGFGSEGINFDQLS
jgi:hypothetical protein